MNTIITPDLVSLDKLTAGSKREVIDALAALVGSAGRSTAVSELAADVWAREETSETGMPGGIAIPHCRTGAVTEATLAFARLAQPVDFGSTDGPADLVFMIAAPDGADQAHLKILSALATSLINDEFLADLRSADSEQRVVDLVAEAVQPAPVTANAGGRSSSSSTAASTAGTRDATEKTTTTVGRLVAVTACPTGIAHTYMAADSLKKAAREAGVELQVETQGSSGATPLGAETIAAADAVIFATDVDVRDRHRFAGKPVIASRVKRGIDEPAKMIAEALAAAKDPNAAVVPSGGSGDSDGSTAASGEREGFGRATQRILMTGVSYMIPFVAAGGLLIALGFLLGGYNITEVATDVALGNSLWNLPTPDQLPEEFLGWGSLGGYLGSVFFTLGGAAMGFLVPALAGYIAFGMADRPGIAPGFTAGAIALTMDAGFIGGIVGGVLAGAVALWFRKLSVPRWL